jgi:exonuclease VII small subunit
LVPKDKSFPSFEEASSNLIEITNLHETVKLPLKEREVLFRK